MDITQITDYRIHAIAREVLERLRVRDDAGQPPRIVTEDDEGGSILRCCLANSRPNERMALVSYAPLRRWSAATGARPGPYDEVGPVFIHPEPCGGQLDFPEIRVGAQRVLRAYTADGSILSGQQVRWPGRAEGEALFAAALADPEVAVVHVRAVEFGCFQFEVGRPDAAESEVTRA